jgi:peptidoglycan hydrolase CwlO-like protein
MGIGELIGALTSGGVMTYVLGWISGRKKNEVEVEGKRLENIEVAIEIYERVHTELKAQLSSLSKECAKLSSKIQDLQKENENLRKEIHSLTQKLKQRYESN